jgi:hypothetical protein
VVCVYVPRMRYWLPCMMGLVAWATVDRSSSPGTATRRATIDQPSPPGTDIFLASLDRRGRLPRLTRVVNVTDRRGYDNQPSFSGTGSALYFTSVRDDAQADIYRYAIATKRTDRITATAPESEYSATEIDLGRALSLIRVEADSTQRLWRVPLGKGSSSPVIAGIKPVGYHAWVTPNVVALFVLGTPATLQVVDLKTDSVRTVASMIGRSVARIPGFAQVSYVDKRAKNTWFVRAYDPKTRMDTIVVSLPPGTEDIAWLPDRTILVGQGTKILAWHPKRTRGWEEIANLAGPGIGAITRIAVSPRGDRVALVIAESG